MRKLRLVFLAATSLIGMAALQGFAPAPEDRSLIDIERASVRYREPGEFIEGTRPVNGPIGEIVVEKPFSIMKRQVTRGDYERCVATKACKALDGTGDPSLPAVGVSFYDAVAYTQWLSRETGQNWRLPTDREWALVAGSHYRDDAYTEISDPANPSRRWIATYNAEAAAEQTIDPAPKPTGTFGENEHGLLDLSGNVWEWTSTCYVRHRTNPAAGTATEVENCGVRIAEGRHRAYMTGFFRDPKAGACSVGIPPANLGMRLVRGEGRLREWLGL